MNRSQPKIYSLKEILDKPERLKDGKSVSIDVLHQAYNHWLKTNAVGAVQIMEDACLLDHFSNRLLLENATVDSLEVLGVLWKSGMVDFSSASEDVRRLVEIRYGKQKTVKQEEDELMKGLKKVEVKDDIEEERKESIDDLD